MGPTSGLERMDLTIIPLLAHADCLMCTRGALRQIVPPTFNKPISLRFSAGSTILTELNDECVMDIAEAVCPRPMTRVTVSEVKKAFRGKVTIFGGVPSVALLEESMPDGQFEAFMKNLFREIAPGDRFILGVSDTTPPDAKFERLLRITEMVNEWGRLPMNS
jgi:hypothetical protein